MSNENIKNEILIGGSELNAGLGITLRRTVLWLSGRDLFAPCIPKLPAGAFRISGPPDPLWAMTLSKDGHMKFMLPAAPNVLHRMTQGFVLGIRWRMLHNVKVRGGALLRRPS